RPVATVFSSSPFRANLRGTLVPTLPLAPVITTRTTRALPRGECPETSVVGVCGRAQRADRAAQQTRHVHLRDADPARDLGLAQVLREPQVQQQTLAFG